MENTINLIKEKALDFFEHNIDNICNDDLQRVRQRREDVSMLNRRKRLCKIIKLGSKSEGNINTEIKTVEEFQQLMNNRVYNRPNSDRYYVVHPVISFSCCLYGKENNNDKWKVSFKPYVIMMEMEFSKATCVHMINREEQLIYTNNVLVM